MNAGQVCVKNGLPKDLIGRERVQEANALGRRKRKIDTFDGPAAGSEQPAAIFVEAGVKLREALDVHGATMREAKLRATREPRRGNLLFATVIVFTGVVRRDGADLE